MDYTVHYDTVERYRDTGQGIVVPVTLRLSPQNEVRLEAKIDTGADYCIFQRVYAETLELDVRAGHRQRFSTTTGDFTAFGHEVTLIAMGIELASVCYFFENEAIRKNVLGRIGWLNKIRLGVDDTQSPGHVYGGRPESR